MLLKSIKETFTYVGNKKEVANLMREMLMHEVFTGFSELLQERLAQKIYTTEDFVRYTFFTALLNKVTVRTIEVILEYLHPNVTYRWHCQRYMTAVLIYFVNPYDVIPDVIPIVGYVDDSAIIRLGYRNGQRVTCTQELK